MRRYHHIITAALLLSAASCQSDVELDAVDPSATQAAITFTTSVAETRATEVKTLETYGKFNVAAFLGGDLYYADLVSYSNSTWSSDVTRYWPVNGDLDFYAYSPLEDDNAGIVLNNLTSYSGYSLTYTCPKDIQDQIDLLVVSLPDQSYASSVGLKFEHALSSIGFNVEFTGESNITLNSISINYIGIESEGIYNFADAEWAESTSPTYFSSPSADLVVDQTETKADTDTSENIVFDDITEQLMIIPQDISYDEKDSHYISIQISYTLNSGMDSSETTVVTGVANLPAPVDNNLDDNRDDYDYSMGHLYTYNITISGDTISIGTVTITDQDAPVAAYGNIDLALITTSMTAEDIGYNETETETDSSAQLYYTTAQRVQYLLQDGVRDFVVVGAVGDGTNYLGNGKLGYYGSTSSPFYIGGIMAGLGSSDLISIDLRGTYGYPEFQYVSENETESTTASVDVVADDDTVLIAGLFAHIDWLDEVIMPHGIAAIGNHSFEGCSALQYIDISDVKHIELGAFQYCEKLEIVDNGALTRVHENGFDSCTSLETIDLSNVTEVDDCGFVDCSSLGEVDLSSLATIGTYAFDGCHSLYLKSGTSIPAFKTVANYAFSECRKLGEIDLTGATQVGDHAFNECYVVTLAIESDDKDGVINMDVLETIGDYAFAKCALIGSTHEVSMAGINSIGVSAFEGCTALNIISGLERLTEISTSAFQGCTSLTGYSSSDEDKVLSLSKVTTVGNLGLSETGVTSVAFSDNLTTIGDHAFDSCVSLITISGLDEVSNVGSYAFSSCRNLTTLELPSLETAGDNFLSGCTKLETLYLPKLTDDNFTGIYESYETSTFSGMIKNLSSTLVDVNLESLVIESFAWDSWDDDGNVENTTLKSLNIASCLALGGNALYGFTALTKVVATSAKSIGDNAFLNCSALEYIDLSSLITLSGWGLFKDNANLQEVYIESVESIPGEAFSGCTALETVNAASATNVTQQAFFGCTALKVIDVSSATSIGAYAFQQCTSLEKLNLSSLVYYTDDNIWAFTGITDNQCEIWLSAEQAALVTGDDKLWQGITWKAIHTDPDTFSLTDETVE